MPKAAIYARFSSDLQRDRSIEDQIALCRDYADRQGFDVTEIYADRAKSGASLHGREGMQRMLADGRERLFDIVIAETMSRIGRDEGDRANIRKVLTFAGVRIMTPADGEVTRLTDGIKALIDSQYLEDLKVMIRRGMAGVTRDGRHAGGQAYGYRAVQGKPGELLIHEEEAAIARRIFADFVEKDLSTRAIAVALNQEGVPSPRGSEWTASTLVGNKKRGTGILMNTLYKGQIVWNRTRMVKDPETGKRVSRPNPEKEWQFADAPHLAIMPAELFDRAQQKLKDQGLTTKPGGRQPIKHLLSGLLKCGCCGGSLTVKDRDHGRVRIQCSNRVSKGTCDNRRIFYLDIIEQTVLAGIKQRLVDPRLLKIIIDTYNQERRELAADSVNRRARIEAKLAAVERNLERIVGLLVKGIISEDEGAAQLPKLRHEKTDLAAELSSLDEPVNVIELHPQTVRRYLDQVEQLEAALNEKVDGQTAEALTIARELIARVTVTPLPDKKMEVKTEGELQRLCAEMSTTAAPDIMSGSLVVAEVRYQQSPQDVLFAFRQRA